MTWIVLGIGLLLLVSFVVLVLLWAITEELPRVERTPFYERLEPGEWGVRLEKVGRRRTPAMRVVNEVLGGDIAAAQSMTAHPPAIIVEGISQPLAEEIVAALAEVGSEAVVFQGAGGE